MAVPKPFIRDFSFNLQDVPSCFDSDRRCLNQFVFEAFIAADDTGEEIFVRCCGNLVCQKWAKTKALELYYKRLVLTPRPFTK